MSTIKIKRGTSSAWTAVNPVLAAGELGLDTTSGQLKVGNGTSTWTQLGYIKVSQADILDLNQGAATTGDLLQWDGTAWVASSVLDGGAPVEPPPPTGPDLTSPNFNLTTTETSPNFTL